MILPSSATRGCMAKHVLPKTLAFLAVAVAAATPAQAASGSLSWAKTDAILGGAPSALEATLAQQSGAAAPTRAPLQPASYSRPAVIPAAIRFGPSPGVLNQNAGAWPEA